MEIENQSNFHALDRNFSSIKTSVYACEMSQKISSPQFTELKIRKREK